MKNLFLIFVICIFSSIIIYSQENDDCLMCHSDPDMTMEKGKKTLSLWVDNSKLIFSAHKKLKCIQCHKGFNPDDVPHKEKIEPVNCKSCHAEIEQKHSFHPWMQTAPLKDNCKNCHGYHTVSNVKGINSNVSGSNSVEKCGSCHTDVKAEYIKSEHFKALQRISSQNAPDCNYCHRNKITKGWVKDYKTRKENQNNVCIGCHKSDTYNPDVIETINSDLSRHSILRKNGKEHAAVCTDCHGFHNIQKNEDVEARLNPKNSFSSCGKCHVHISQEYQNSIHGIAQMKGNLQAASCVSCHFEHDSKYKVEVTDEIYKLNLLDKNFSEKSGITNCIQCHTNDTLMQSGKLETLKKSHSWLPELQKHFLKVSCYDCHASYTEPYLSHNILPLNKSIRKCNTCHDKTVELRSVLYNYEKNKSVKKDGLIDGNIKGSVNYVGLARNIILDYLSLIILGGLVLGLIIHGYIRWYFKTGKVKK